jgi:hypothetical protein
MLLIEIACDAVKQKGNNEEAIFDKNYYKKKPLSLQWLSCFSATDILIEPG